MLRARSLGGRVAEGWPLGLLLGALLGCGGSEDDAAPACEPVVACGGDVLGTWRVMSSCANPEALTLAIERALPPECGESLSAAEIRDIDLAMTYDRSGSWTTAGALQFGIEYSFDDTCLAALWPGIADPGAACAANLSSAVNVPSFILTDRVGSGVCTYGQGGCDCRFDYQSDAGAAGMYAVADGQIVSAGTTMPYCISGDEMRYGDPALGTNVARRE